MRPRLAFLLLIVACGSLRAATIETAADYVTVSGSVAYRQRIAMSPDAVLMVRVEDVSRADAPATVMAEAREPFGARQVPIAFSLQVPSAAIDPRASYAVRATITTGDELRFTTTRSHAVLTHGAANHVDLVLDAVQAARPASAVGFALPATFTGVLPCADCEGVAQTLTLRPDGLYRLRRTYLGKAAAPFAEVGRWTADARSSRLLLSSGTQRIQFKVINDSTLRLLDAKGQPIESAANLDLHRAPQVDPVSEQLHWRGEFRYLADAATFTDCASGVRWPVEMSGDYLALERNYLQHRSAPGASLLVSMEGRLEQGPARICQSGGRSSFLEARPATEGAAQEMMVVERFDSSHPGETCSSAPGNDGAKGELKDTYWKLIELDGKPVVMAPAQAREVRITLASEGSRLIGFAGCNQFAGGYVEDGGALRFTQMAGTMMACTPPLMVLESEVHKMLAATTGYRIEGERLTLLGGDRVLARFASEHQR